MTAAAVFFGAGVVFVAVWSAACYGHDLCARLRHRWLERRQLRMDMADRRRASDKLWEDFGRARAEVLRKVEEREQINDESEW